MRRILLVPLIMIGLSAAPLSGSFAHGGERPQEQPKPHDGPKARSLAQEGGISGMDEKGGKGEEKGGKGKGKGKGKDRGKGKGKEEKS